MLWTIAIVCLVAYITLYTLAINWELKNGEKAEMDRREKNRIANSK